METIKLIAVDIDGVLVEDTFSPVLRSIVFKLGGEYTRELERNVFSRPRHEGRDYIFKTFNITEKDIPHGFFEERKKYIQAHGCGLIEGVPEFLELLHSLEVKLICYGGLTEELTPGEFKNYLHYFDQYICTNDFRPGIREITKNFYDLEYNQVLFIDDVNTVAEAAKSLNVPFIGIPAGFSWGFQREDMIKTGVKYLLHSIRDIDSELLDQIDREAAAGTIWDNGERA